MKQNRIIILVPIGIVMELAMIVLLFSIPQPNEAQFYYFFSMVLGGTILVFIGLSSKILGSD